MDTEDKLALLGQQAQFDLSCACGTDSARTKGLDGRWIYPAALPNGRRMPVLKVLMNNACERNCLYCPQRANRANRRVGFSPDEMARLFDKLHRAHLVMGLFLSSAIVGHVRSSMDRLLATAAILRRRYRFHGFIHLKILPGAERAQVEEAITLANRVSINVEAPGQQALSRIAAMKDFQREIMTRIQWIAELLALGRSLCSGQTTQFVVGAAKEADREILHLSDQLYRLHGLKRVYFSAFQPVMDTPLETKTPTPFMREHRLYQADFLLRKYGFLYEDIPFDDQGLLDLEQDPKTQWAEQNREIFPLEINKAPKELLLRIPGLGPITVGRILKRRREQHFTNAEELRQLSPTAKKAAPFLLLNGKKARLEEPDQLSFW